LSRLKSRPTKQLQIPHAIRKRRGWVRD